MKIEINSDGFSKNTEVKINGRKIEDNTGFFGISIKFPGKVKITQTELVKVDGRTEELPKLSLWGAQLQEIDKMNRNNGDKK